MEANKIQSSLSKSFEASASNKVIHPETFTIPSYQVKKAETLLEVHSILTHTTQRAIEKYVKLTKFLFPDSEIPEQLELGRTKLGYLLQFGLAPYYKSPHYFQLLVLHQNLYLALTRHLVTSEIRHKWMFMFFIFMRRNNK